MLGYLWFLFWQLAGLFIISRLYREKPALQIVWLGSSVGSLLAAWMPVPFAFLFGFTRQAHLAAVVAGLLGLSFALYATRNGTQTRREKTNLACLWLVIPFCVLSFVILANHTLVSTESGIYTGQCTYGDMSMHLGFITSLAEQESFPPYYSILPSAKLCYPFLCDSISASLYLLGSSLRGAYMFPSFFALCQVFLGFWFLAYELTGSSKAAAIAFLFFFLNGGFGTFYFINGDHSLSELLTGFYVTPTNLTKSGIRWVNVIADMLIPQRATLYGWSLLFPALFLLYKAVREGKARDAYLAGCIGGLLPMVHTHSFFALGLTAMCWMVYSYLQRESFRKWMALWLRFGLTAVILAIPQLIIWTFHSVGGNAHFLRIGLDWVNGFKENWFLFWFKNVGVLFVLIPLAYIRLIKDRDRRTGIYSPIFFIFILAEIVLFQPNPYDNNKLFYVGYLFGCILSAEYLLRILSKRKTRQRLATLVLLFVLSANAAVLTLARELVSGESGYSYQLFNNNDIAAAEYIKENAAPDSVFLTASNHNNTVAVLTGRNIVCGSPSYVYYHGLDYSKALTDEQSMLSDGENFETLRSLYGIDYIYISRHEKQVSADLEFFKANYPIVYENAEITIFKVTEDN